MKHADESLMWIGKSKSFFKIWNYVSVTPILGPKSSISLKNCFNFYWILSWWIIFSLDPWWLVAYFMRIFLTYKQLLYFWESSETNSLPQHTSLMWNIDMFECIILSPLSLYCGRCVWLGTQAAMHTNWGILFQGVALELQQLMLTPL